MSNQADFKKVDENIIKPIQRHYGVEFEADTIADFVDDLARYSVDVLKKAMQQLRGDHKRKPTLAHVIDACRAHLPKNTPSGKTYDAINPQRFEKQKKMVDDYVSHFEAISMTKAEADREGWSLDLWRYVRAVANIQAQMIANELQIGWDGSAVFGFRTVGEDERKAFFSDCRRQANTGQIDVGIPAARIKEWKAKAEYYKRFNHVAAPAAVAPRISAQTPFLDAEIERQLEVQGYAPKKIDVSQFLEEAP